MDAGLVVVPHADHGQAAGGAQVQVEDVAAARGEGGQPQVHVVLGAVDSVQQVAHHAGVSAVGRQHVDVWGVGPDEGGSQGLSAGAEHLQAVEAHVVPVPPGGQDVDNQPSAPGQHRDLKVLLPLRRSLFLPVLTQRGGPRGGRGGEGVRRDGGLRRGPRPALPPEELVEDVPLQTHVGDASALAAVEAQQGVPGLPQRVVLLAARLGGVLLAARLGGALPPGGCQGEGLVYNKNTHTHTPGGEPSRGPTPED